MYTEQHSDFTELANEIYKQNSDEIIREQCRAREEAEAYEQHLKNQIAEKDSKIEVLEGENEILAARNEALTRFLKKHNIPLPDDLT